MSICQGEIILPFLIEPYFSGPFTYLSLWSPSSTCPPTWPTLPSSAPPPCLPAMPLPSPLLIACLASLLQSCLLSLPFVLLEAYRFTSWLAPDCALSGQGMGLYHTMILSYHTPMRRTSWMKNMFFSATSLISSLWLPPSSWPHPQLWSSWGRSPWSTLQPPMFTGSRSTFSESTWSLNYRAGW